MTATWTEAEIAAFVDGELSSADADRIARVLVSDVDARVVADRIRATNDALKAAFAAPMDEQIPDAIFRTVAEQDRGGAGPSNRSATVTPLRRHRDRSRSGGNRRWMPMALAACIALVVGFGTGGVLLPETAGPLTSGDAPSGGALHAALETLPSGTVSSDGIQPMMTFADADGRLCREFEATGVLPGELGFGIACRTAADIWHVEILVTAPMVSPSHDLGTSDRPTILASGPGPDALDAMLDALGAGPRMTVAEEAQLIAEGWHAP